MSRKSKTPPQAPPPTRGTAVPPVRSSGFPHDVWIVPLIFGIVFLSFLPSLKNGFVGWDDSGMFLENIEYRGLKWANIKWMFTTFHYAHYHPITWLTLGFDYQVWGMNPKGYHLTSLIIHGLNGVLFYFLIKMFVNVAHASRTIGQAGNVVWSWANGNSGILFNLGCAVGALFFAIHPLRVESVAWATERRDVLSGFFYLLTLNAYVRAQTSDERRRWLCISVVFFLLSFLSKAWGITLPLVLLILDVYPLRRVAWNEKLLPQIGKLVMEKTAFFVVAIVLSIVAYKGQAVWGIEHENISLWKRLAISAFGFCFYLWKMAVPFNLSPLYGLPRDLDPFAPQYLGCAGALIFVTATLIVFRRRCPWGLAAWFCYGLIVAPVIGLTQKGDQIAADRYTYLCLLPFAALLGAGLSSLALGVGRGVERNLKRLGGAVIIVLLLAILGGALSFLTYQQTKIWRDDFALWVQALKVEPHNAIAHNGRGRILMERGELDAAMADFNQAIELNPKIVSARNNRGMVFYNKGNLDAALADFQAALKIHPQHEIYNNCGAIREVRGDLKGAIQDYTYAVQSNPRYSVGYFNRARARKREGDFVRALEDFNAAVKWDPLYAEAYLRRGDLLAQQGRIELAVQDYSNALRLAPANWQYRNEVQQRLAQANNAQAK